MSELQRDSCGDPRPEPPAAPDAAECCHSGCRHCVYDRYWDALDRYEAALEAWKKRNPGS